MLKKNPWTARKSYQEVVRETITTRSLMRMRKGQGTFFDHIMRRGGLEHPITTDIMEGT